MTPRSITEPTADGAVILDEGNRIVYARLPDWPNADGGSCHDAFVWFDIGNEELIRKWIADGRPPLEDADARRVRSAYPFTWAGLQNVRRSGVLRSADNELAMAVTAALDQIRAML